jgi:hypothetical protein
MNLLLFLLLSSAATALGPEHELSLVSGVEYRAFSPTFVNVDRTKSSKWSAKSELRSNLLFSSEEIKANHYSFQARPRLSWQRNWRENATLWNIEFKEVFGTWSPWADGKLRLGRFHQGWGPSESFSLSNWMVPFLVWEPSPYFEQDGITKAEVTGFLAEGQLLQLLVELPPLRSQWSSPKDPWKEEFKKRTLARWELTKPDGNFNLGLTAGSERERNGNSLRLGSYASITINDTWQFFFDARYSPRRGRIRFPIDTSGLLGLRYTFSNGAETRAEWLHQSGGIDGETQKRERSILSQLSPIARAQVYRQSSQNLKGENYGILSFRWLNLPINSSFLQDPSVYVRVIRSFTDSSATGYLGFEGGLSDTLSFALFGGSKAGPNGRELNGLYERFCGTNLRFVF